MEHREKNSKQLLFLEGINKDIDEEKLINRLITKLEQLGFNIIGKEDEKKSEAKEFNCQPTLHNLNEFLKNSL